MDHKGNLLIVDDESLLLKRLKANLEEVADAIFTASDGVEALSLIGKQAIHCVVCDINMPKMNGLEVIKQLRAQNIEIPLIFYTGHGSGELMNEATKYGAFDFLNKPDLIGLEEVVSRGLKTGLGQQQVVEREDFEDDFKKLMDEIK